jgi:hypothetical protein
MYTRRELICEANPFKWMAQKQINKPEPGPVMSQIGSGIKRGLGMAFNNPLTRAASELQKAAIPGAGRTRQQLRGMLGNIFRSPNVRRSRFYKQYRSLKQQNPSQFTEPTKPQTKNVPSDEIQATAQKENRIPVKTKVNGKISQQFGLVDNDGNILYTFHPFILQREGETNQPRMGGDTGFIVWDAKTGNQEIIDQPLKTTDFAKEPNFIAL